MTSNGQGHAHGVLTACDRTGSVLDPAQVTTRHDDTDMALAGGPAVGSRSGQSVSTAITRTIDVMLEKGKKIAGQMLEASDADIEFADGQFQVMGTDRRVALMDVAKRAKEMKARGEITETLDTKEKVDTGLTFPNGCHLAEVEIDPDTGHVDVVSYKARR